MILSALFFVVVITNILVKVRKRLIVAVNLYIMIRLETIQFSSIVLGGITYFTILNRNINVTSHNFNDFTELQFR
jgi:hypothetical protein